MKFEIIASTKPYKKFNKEAVDDFCGKVGGICYMPSNFETLMGEPAEKTAKRVQMTMGNGHHSVFEHPYITLHLEGIPKLFAMVLNNENVYVTSEKSARYTKMVCTEEEQKLYDKWQAIFEKKIREKYPENNSFITDSRIKKLAQENARYLISVKTPTSMIHTMSYRRINYLCKWMADELKNPKSIYAPIFDAFESFIKFAKENNLLDERLQRDGKHTHLSLFNIGKQRTEIFDDVYSTNYKTSFACLAQAQRHRTLNYEINNINKGEFYIPKIIENTKDLADEWQSDLYKLKDLLPQGTLLNINERGTLENFLLKCKERLCTFAQLEINDQTKELLTKYYQKTKNPEIKKLLSHYQNGSRCTFPDYDCLQPCGFPEGVAGQREI